MKSIFVLLAITSLYATAYAQDAGFDAVLICKEANGIHFFTVLRLVDDVSRGVVKYGTADMNYVPMVVQEDSYDAEIAYTNAGARAIVSSGQFPQLIFAGQGSKNLIWNEKNWMCQSFL